MNNFCFCSSRNDVPMNGNEKQQNYLVSGILALRIGALPLCCWRNAALAMLDLPELFERGEYIEGWIVVPDEKSIRVVEHGWCLTNDHQIVDPSIVLLEEEGQSIDYFSGVAVSRGQLQQAVSKTILPLVCHTNYGEDGMNHRGYSDAYERACQMARVRAQEKHLDERAIEVDTKDNKLGMTILQQR